MGGRDGGRCSGGRVGWLLFAGLAVYGLALWVWRPATPFEQDEVLFLRALDRYDVAKHAPHPPGYPLYVAVGKVVRWAVGTPESALELVAVAASLATLAGAWLLARRLGAGRPAATLAAAVTATVPTFLFHGSVGFSDIPGTAVALLAAFTLVIALERPSMLPLGAILTAAACAVRPQLVLLLLPLGVAALALASLKRRWGAIAGALAAGVAVSLACWLPAVLVTGPARFRQAILDAGRWAAEHEAGARLPAAPVGSVVRHWLVNPWGDAVMAAVFWLAVAAGAATWWRRGRRRLVAVAAGCSGLYIVAGAFTMEMGEAVRYVLPAVPFLALLAAGTAEARSRTVARISVAGLAAWCVAAAVWIAPLIGLRARKPAPVWECLTWVATHADPARTLIVFDDAFRPHAGYLLGARGFHLEELRPGVTYTCPVPGGSVLFVTRTRPQTGNVLIERNWDVAELKPLSRGLYEHCVVTLQAEGSSVQYTGGFSVTPNGWELAREGAVSLPEGAPVQLAQVRAGNTALLLTPAGSPPVAVPAGGEAFALVPPGAAGAMRLEVAGGGTTRFPGLQLFPVAGDAWRQLAVGGGKRMLVVPSAAHVQGRWSSLWVTDLVLRNTSTAAPVDVTMRWSQRLSFGGGTLTRHAVLAPGMTLLLHDVIATDFHAQGSGAMLLSADGGLVALWATYDRNAPRTLTDPAFLAALDGAQTVRRGAMVLEYRPGAEGVRSNAAFFSPSGSVCEVKIEVKDREGRRTPSGRVVRLPAWAFELLDGERLFGPTAGKLNGAFDIRFEAPRPVYAFVSVVANGSNRTRYEFAGLGEGR